MKVMPYVDPWSGFIFCNVRSLQMRIIGIWQSAPPLEVHSTGLLLTLVFFTSAFNAPTPPRSPADIPSTSSMIKHVLLSMRMPPAAVVLCHQPTLLALYSGHTWTPLPAKKPSSDVLSMLVEFCRSALTSGHGVRNDQLRSASCSARHLRSAPAGCTRPAWRLDALMSFYRYLADPISRLPERCPSRPCQAF